MSTAEDVGPVFVELLAAFAAVIVGVASLAECVVGGPEFEHEFQC